MDERSRVLAEFDRQHGIAPKVGLSSINIPFWDLVTFCLKLAFALIIASVIIGTILGIPVLLLMLLISAA